ncbi:035b0284-11ba-4294-ba53-2808ee51b5af-CDS [Sclerotinia trifoliorum]|uniref:035b0284-11ba-4294-ba53-2808ee51b5af-CDS n=1 Tax=Sclerotinia trifoliorum TaxID=28548 RepID=A0A8H2VXU8_9HELO|nr:035b0284-11ba-4294-ba53-2808ee51b5af-CDS [Sclerotinia trifoliorum]
MEVPESVEISAEILRRSEEVPVELGYSNSSLLASIDLSHLPANIETLLLPHTHSPYNPFSIFFTPNAKTPSTPLNTFLLSQISTAKSSINIYTPNITYTPLINALFEALTRGIDIRIVVSRKLMILEQIVTAGTLTEWEIYKMERRYRKLVARSSHRTDDLEAGINTRIGNLEIVYFNPALVNVNERDRDNRTTTRNEEAMPSRIEDMEMESRPVKLHLKMTVIDSKITVLGSGNMDRASWVTSQEVGIAIFSEEVARRLIAVVRDVYG